MFCCEEGSSCAGGDTNLVVDVLDVVVYGLLRDDEKTCYLLFGVSAGDQSQYLDFALTQSCHEFPAGRAYLVTCCCEDTVCGFTIKSSCTHFTLQLLGGDFGSQRWTVWPWLGHSMIDIGSGKNPGGREHGGLQSTIVARAVEPLVVESSQCSQAHKHPWPGQHSL